MRALLLNAVTAVATGDGFTPPSSDRTFQATVEGTGAVGATVLIEATNDGKNFLTLATITLSGTTSATDGFASTAKWEMVRARVSAISGTGAAVTVIMGA